MASDHLWVNILFGSISHKALLYSPSTIQILKAELSLRHGVNVEGMEVWYEGVQQGDKERVVDGRHYHVRVPMTLEAGQREAVEEGVFIGEGVTLTQDIVVAHKMGAQTLREGKNGKNGKSGKEEEEEGTREHIYTIFGFRGILHLVEHQRRCVLSPAGNALPRHKAIFYVDWVTLRPLLLLVPKESHETWISRQLEQAYGAVEGMYRVEGIHKADVDEMVRYQNVVMNWLDVMGISDEEEDEDEGIDGFDDLLEEEGEEEKEKEKREWAYEA